MIDPRTPSSLRLVARENLFAPMLASSLAVLAAPAVAQVEFGFAAGTPETATAPMTDGFVQFDLGEGSLSVGRRANGTLRAWGTNPPAVPSGSFTHVTVGRNCAIAIDAAGTLVPFGENEFGRLDVPTGSFIDVSAADATWHAAGVRSDGSLACWGYNNHGQCNPPTGSFVKVAAGGHNGWSGFTAAIRSDGTLAAWGDNTWGQRNVAAGGGFVEVKAGYYHALARRADGTLAGWGWNAQGQSTVPAGTYIAIACGSNESVAIRSDGTIATFGGVPAHAVELCAQLTDAIAVGMTCCGSVVALVASDCDGNGQPDIREIANGTRADADGDFIPDCCEDGTGCASCLGDLTGDGFVNAADLAPILASWGDFGKNHAADLNGDGLVDAADITVVLTKWGACE